MVIVVIRGLQGCDCGTRGGEGRTSGKGDKGVYMGTEDEREVRGDCNCTGEEGVEKEKHGGGDGGVAGSRFKYCNKSPAGRGESLKFNLSKLKASGRERDKGLVDLEFGSRMELAEEERADLGEDASPQNKLLLSLSKCKLLETREKWIWSSSRRFKGLFLSSFLLLSSFSLNSSLVTILAG